MSRLSLDEKPSRVVIEGVRPEVDGGRFPAKRTVGETVDVSAEIFSDGHDRLAAVLRYRVAEAPLEPREGFDADWHETPLSPLGNDRWSGTFRVQFLGRYEYTLQAWIDRFGSWREELSKKFAAKQQVDAELLEGAQMLCDTARRAMTGSRADGGTLVQAPPGSRLSPSESDD